MTSYLIYAAYALGWFVTAVVAMRRLSRAPSPGRCHGLDGRWWNDPRDCRTYHSDDCWRPCPPGLDAWRAASGAAIALIWPVVAPVAFAAWVAGRPFGPKPETAAAAISRLEREIGI